MDTPSKYAIDAVAAGTMVASLMDWLPAVAAAFTIIWTAIRIYETKTIQKLLGRQ